MLIDEARLTQRGGNGRFCEMDVLVLADFSPFCLDCSASVDIYQDPSASRSVLYLQIKKI
jgi:hypothetical protein